MNTARISIRAAWLLAGVLLAWPLALPSPAWADDIFDFIPWGGRTLLARVLATKPAAADARALLTGKHSRDEWLKELQARGKAVPALQRLTDKERLTLADYLSHNMPLPASRIPADLARANWEKLLPMDGKDMALDYCQGCHIITVVVTQDRAREHWLGTLHKPSHIEIKLTEAQREALASYLVINAAIPIDQVPEDLRAGGATY
jgi:mono/diheme cytochrome c family protein